MILVNGQKMSKSIGNVVDPLEVLEKHGTEAFRYFFLRHIDTFADSDFTWDKFEDAYNNELANDLGNLVQRLATLCQKNGFVYTDATEIKFSAEYVKLMDEFRFKDAFDFAWGKVQEINKKIDDKKPWVLKKENKEKELFLVLKELVDDITEVNKLLSPFLPETSKRISEIFVNEIMPPEQPLFPKK
jgi:methionyl-tRNA synthetase